LKRLSYLLDHFIRSTVVTSSSLDCVLQFFFSDNMALPTEIHNIIKEWLNSRKQNNKSLLCTGDERTALKKRVRDKNIELGKSLPESFNKQFSDLLSKYRVIISPEKTNKRFRKRKVGIDLRFMPICPVGLEMERVRQHRDISTDDLVVGSVEQNIFTPLLFKNPHLEIQQMKIQMIDWSFCRFKL